MTMQDRAGATASPRSRVRRRRILVVALILPLLLLELALRGMVAAGWLPEAPSRDPQVDGVLLGLTTGPRQDILLMGDSLMRRDVDPAVLAELVGEATGSVPKVASVAQLDVDIRTLLLLARELGRVDRSPRAMVVGLSMGNYGGPRADPGMLGIERSPMGAVAGGCDSRRTPVPWIECLISQGSVAWRWRGEPARLLRALLSRGAPEDVATADGTLRSDGFEATTGRTQAELDEMLATSYRGTVVDFTPERVAAAGSELRELVDYLRSQGVAVILVSVPYPPPLLEAVMERSPDIAAEDTAALDALSAATGTTIHRTGSMGEWWTPAASNDLKHLSATGAEAFTRQLWGSLPLRAALLDAIGAEPAASTTP
jgi:hypothetical protein